MKNLKPNRNICIGRSMYPTIQEADILITDTFEAEKTVLKIGDIIVFYDEVLMSPIVHRIVKICDKEVVTRGDNNDLLDRPITNFKNIKYKVSKIKRNNKEIKLICGKTGYFINSYLSFKRKILKKISPLIRCGSITLENLRILNFVGIFMRVKKITISNKEGQEIKTIIKLGNNVIGKRINEKWLIKAPYKYFISRRKLDSNDLIFRCHINKD